MDPTIAARRGRIVKTTGDGILAEFPRSRRRSLLSKATT
jgi:class 3 adenylate cyclase